MQIECPSCGHSSELPDHLIGEDGKDLTCPSCSSSFTVLPGGWTTQPEPSGSAGASPSADPESGGNGGGARSPFDSHGPSDVDSDRAVSPGASPSGGSSSSSGTQVAGQQTPSRRAPDLEAGTVLAEQFEIEGQIGRGAVATVYAARDTELDEPIALKAIPTFGNTEAAKRAVLPEYKAVRSLKSGGEHILHIDRPTVCEHAGMDWVLLPMERAERSLREWLEETKTDPGVEERLEEGLSLLRQACRGVEALHAEGLAHMDLKPGNLLLTRENPSSDEETEWTVKIADFGLARSLRRGEVLNEEVVAEGVGTPYYMAPEQIWAARQKEVGPEADIYSLGVILFELLDGDRPFDGTAETVREKHREMAPPAVHTDVPGRLEELAHACLRKEAGERPQIEDLIDGLAPDREDGGGGKTREKAEIDASEAGSAEPDEATQRKVRRALEQENLQPVEESLGRGETGTEAALQEEAESFAEERQGALLRTAAAEGHAAVAKGLLRAGADPEAADEDGNAPLHYAAQEGAVEVVEALLDEWADLESCVHAPEDKVPVEVPKLAESITEQTVIAHRKQPGEEVKQDEILFETETDKTSTEVLSPVEGVLDEILVEEGETVSVGETVLVVSTPASDEGQTPLHKASCSGHLRVVERLVEAGADVEAVDHGGWTPLHCASNGGHTEIAEVLLENEAQVGATDRDGKTPLHRAAHRDKQEVAEVLLRKGANVNAVDAEENTPLDYANEDSDCARTLRQRGGEKSDDLTDRNDSDSKDSAVLDPLTLRRLTDSEDQYWKD